MASETAELLRAFREAVRAKIARDLQGEGRISMLADTLRLEYAENTGAFLSLGAKLPERARFWISTVGVAALLAWLLWWAVRSQTAAPVQAVAAALVVGGGLSNWIDRVVRDGRAIDFLNLGLGPVRTGIFNVADVAIVAGAAMLALLGRSKRVRYISG
jgi:signal peptidase II